MSATLRHGGLSVRDLDKTLGFLVDVLGFAVERRFAPIDPGAVAGITGLKDAVVDEIAIVAKDGFRIELLAYRQPGARGVTLQASDAGFAHWAFEVTDFAATIAAARRHGFTRSEQPYRLAQGPDAGMQAAYLTNGDGFTIELIGPAGEPAQ